MSGKLMKHRLMLGAAIAMIFCSLNASIIAVADDAPIDSILADAHQASGIEPTPTCDDLSVSATRQFGFDRTRSNERRNHAV